MSDRTAGELERQASEFQADDDLVRCHPYTGHPLDDSKLLQEWLGYRDYTATLLYAGYAPNPHEAELIERAFAPADPGRAVSGMLP
jgi:hypothetical protein